MAGTYSQLIYHFVFSTKLRSPLLTPAVCERLYPFIGGIVRGEKGVLGAVGGVEDHIHLLIRWRTDVAVAVLMREVKARSSKWMNETFADAPRFAWQDGYSVFTVSESQAPVVKRYLANQAEHHATMDFKTELRKLLEAHSVVFDERYLVE